MKKIAIICFTPYKKEPRVLKTINALRSNYHLTLFSTISTENDFEFYDIAKYNNDFVFNTFSKNKFINRCYNLFQKLFLNIQFQSENYFKKQYWNNGRGELLKIIVKNKYDLIIAHDIITLPILASLQGKKIFNAHEHYLKEFESNTNWKKYTQPYYNYILKTYLKHIDKMFCVSENIQDEYQKEFLINSVVINNASPFVDLKPSPVNLPIQLVHHGVAMRNRKLELMIEAVKKLGSEYQLYFYLVDTDKEYINELKNLCNENNNIFFNNAIPLNQLTSVINKHDVGIYILPPQNFNDLHALPNKLYEFIQARLCLCFSPNPEMKNVIDTYKVGVTIEDYTSEALVNSIKNLNTESIKNFKNNSDKHAKFLSAETTESLILEEVNNLLK